MVAGRFQPGQSGNPKGRPKKDRALTTLLEAAGTRMVATDDGRMQLRKIAIANIWDAVTRGRVRFLDGYEMPLHAKDYVELIKFLFTHIDGPAKPEETAESKEVTIRVIYDEPVAPPMRALATTIDEYRDGVSA